MAKRLSTAQTQRASLPALIELVSLNIEDRVTLNFVGSTISAQPVYFQGTKYHPASLSMKGFHAAADKAAATPVIIISNPEARLHAAVQAGAMSGKTLTRIVTFKTELDPPHGTGNGAQFETERWEVDRVLRLDQYQLHLQLVPALYLEKKTLPFRMILQDICQHSYRRWDEEKQAFDYTGVSCPYTGNQFFDTLGQASASPAADRCSLRLDSGCKKRFKAVLPFFGFPGVR